MIEFYVNEEKKTVAAKITNTSEDAVNYIRKAYGLDDYEYSLDVMEAFDNCNFSAQMEDSYVAVAKCCDGDEFNADTGKAIAARRVCDTHNRALKNAIRNWQVKVLRKLRQASQETFYEAIEEVCGEKIRSRMFLK